MLAGLLADRLGGEVRRFHPLVGFGRWAGALESAMRRLFGCGRGSGLLAWALAVLPWLVLALWLRNSHPLAHWPVDVVLLYFALGGRSLAEHANAIATPLASGELARARLALARIVSRDTNALDAPAIATAATESVLENGNDAVFGTLFWFLLGGGIGALLFRLANTLDAMWGYRTARYRQFGWAAARIDDLLNFAPARLTALSYALLGNTVLALRCWHRQAAGWGSGNAGTVMAAGAGALGVRLGGSARYAAQLRQRPLLGAGSAADAASIRAAVKLVRRSMVLWCLALLMLSLGAHYALHAHA